MDNTDIIQKLEELLQKHANPAQEGKVAVSTEEAVASVSQFVFDAIRQKSEEYVADKEEAQKEKAQLQEAEERLKASVGELEDKLSEAEDHLARLEGEKLERQAKERFNDRMAIIDSAYELNEEDLVIIASQVNDLADDDESFEAYKEQFAVVWSHKSKEAVAAAKEAYEARIEEEVQRHLQEAKASAEAAPAPEVSEEDTVTEVLDNVSEADASIPNNNEELIEEEESLRQRFKQAFNQDNLTIKY